MDLKGFCKGYAVALGNFDGVHLGHNEVINTARQKARELDCHSAVITFAPHPAKVLSNNIFQEILSFDEKVSIIKSLGVDQVIVINFTEELSKMPAESFINELCEKLNIKSITTGYNFRFGYNRHGDIKTINSLKKKYHFKFNTINQILYNHSHISSSVLRQVIKLGCLKLFSQLTGRQYYIECQYLNSTEGYHSYNISNTNLLMPPDGVYLGKVSENYGCIFLNGSNVKLKLLESNGKILTTQTKVTLLNILGQESELDKSYGNELKIGSYIKKAKFCLNL